jgi:hypothetical protein
VLSGMDTLGVVCSFFQFALTEGAHAFAESWRWSWGWRFRWYLAAGVAVLVALAICGRTLTRYFQRWRRYRSAWINRLVNVELRRRRPRSVSARLWEWSRTLPDPNRGTVVAIVGSVVFAYLFQYLTKLVSEGGFNAPERSSVESTLGSLLQAHVTVAGVALPILMFVIERARDEEETRLPASEVVMRESWIVPLTIFAFLTSVKIGWDYAGFGLTAAVVVTDAILFSATVLLTARAVFLTLRLSFGRSMLKEKGLDLIRRKAGMSAERSARLRLAENTLLRVCEELRVGFRLFGTDRDTRERFHVVDAMRNGVVVDVNAEGLREFIEALRFKPLREAREVGQDQAAVGAEAEEQVQPASKELEKVFLGRRIGQKVSARAGGLLLIEKTSVESFESIDRRYWVKRIFRLEA